MTKRYAALAVLVPATMVLGCAPAVWVRGTTSDPVLGAASITATGGQAAPGALALAAVSAGAFVAVVAVGRRLRAVAAVLMVATAGAAAALVVRVLLAPAQALGRRAAEQVGRVGSVATDAAATAWLWVAVVAALAMLGATVAAGWGARHWAGLSPRFERSPAAPGDGRAGHDPLNAWDALSRGADPTADTPPPAT